MTRRRRRGRWLGTALLGLTIGCADAATTLPDEESTWAAAYEHDAHRGELTEAQALAAVDAARRSTDAAAELVALANLLALDVQGSDAKAYAPSLRLVDLARGFGDQAWVARGLFMQAVCVSANPELAPGVDWRALFDESMRIARQRGLKRLLADNYAERASPEINAGQGGQAIDDINQSRVLYESLHENFLLAATYVTLAGGYRIARTPSPEDLQTAERMLSLALATFDPAIDRDDIANSMIEKGQIQRRLGELDAAEATLKSAADFSTHANLPALAALAHLRLGQMLLERDRPADALRALESTPRPLAESRWHWEPLVVAAWDAIAKAQSRLGHRAEAVAALASAEVALKSANIPRVASDVHATEAQVWAALGDYPQANAALQLQMTSDAESAKAADEGRMQELRVKYESDLKERDNALLRAQTAQAESRRAATSLALVLAVLVFGGGALVLMMRLKTTRAANRLMATLADNGRRMTSGLDRSALVRMLESQLAALIAPASTVVSLRHEDDGAAHVDAQAPPPAWAAQMEALRHWCEQASTEVSQRLPATRDALRRRPWRALRGARLVAEPLLDGSRLLGVVTVAFDEGGRWGNRERQILRTTCLYAAVALANIRSARLLGEAQVELEQERTRDMLVHTARLVTVGSMASGIVHEMAHPVGAMMLQSSNAQASLEMGEPGDANDALSGIHREARRLQNLIVRLRNLCRADQPNIEAIDLLDVLEDARVLFLPQLQMARVEFLQQATPMQVTVDSERVVLAIANIVFNAIDAMEGRDVKRIEVTTSVQGGYACVDIRDTGPGLTPTQLARLFEPFYTTKPPGKGLGLGLALSVKSVASMNGRIEATNHAGGGAVFTVCLPIAPSPSTAPAAGQLSWTEG